MLENTYMQAKTLGACDRLTGSESLAELCELFRSAQGMEFCIENKFPNMATLREYKKLGVQQYGVYVDAGKVEIDNPEVVVLLGHTSATVNVNRLGRHRVYAIRGANARITTSGWAVCVVKTDTSAHVIKVQNDNSIII